MRVAVFNAGSSSLKSRLFEGSAGGDPLRPLASESADRIGEGGAPDHAAAAIEILKRFVASAFDAIGHRVVHGGSEFSAPARLTEETIAGIEALGDIAPLHNRPALSVIRACAGERPGMPQVAVFDTSFHAAMPQRAAAYAIDPDLARRHGIRRFGFHGIAHRSLMEQYAALTGRNAGELRLITFQLGNGCSACAIDRGRSVETSMGFTPLEGLVMGTRSGDLDPALVAFLARRERMSADDVVTLFNKSSGLLGLSGISRDLRLVEEAAAGGDARARLAIDLFAYRARKFLGAYLAVLGSADAVLLGGGIGEHSPAMRAAILEGLEGLGLRLDPNRNASPGDWGGRISADESKIEIRALSTDEESIIASDTVELLSGPAPSAPRPRP